MSGFRPALSVSVGGQTLSGPEAAIVALGCELSAGAAHDRAVIDVTHGSPLMHLALGDEIVVALGYDDAREDVFTGGVSSFEAQPWGASVEVLSPTTALSQLRTAGAYIEQTAGDVISDLAAQAEVELGVVDASVTLAAYFVDEGKSGWDHVLALAHMGGYSVTVDAAGALQIAPLRSSPVEHQLRFGAELLSWAAGGQVPPVGQWQAVAHGAASELGGDKWFVPLKRPGEGSADRPARVFPPCRTKELADVVTEAQAGRVRRGRLLGLAVAVGNGQFRAGQVLELQDLPGQGTVSLRCRSVEHLWSAPTGFQSRLLLEGTP